MFINKKIFSDEFEKFNKIRFERIEQNMRDYFAGQVISELSREQWTASQFNPVGIAERAYIIADAMINERKKLMEQTK